MLKRIKILLTKFIPTKKKSEPKFNPAEKIPPSASMYTRVSIPSDFKAPQIKILKNSLLKTTLGTVAFNPEQNILYVEVATWVMSWELNVNKFYQRILENRDFTLSEISGAIELDPLAIPSCVHFVPSEAGVNIGGKLPDDWPYQRANKTPQCTNKDLVSPNYSDDCGFFPSTVNCQAYKAHEWTLVKEGILNDVRVIALNQKFYACNLLKYQIEMNGQTNLFDTLEEAEKAFDEHNSKAKELGFNVYIKSPISVSKTSYLETVLTEKV